MSNQRAMPAIGTTPSGAVDNPSTVRLDHCHQVSLDLAQERAADARTDTTAQRQSSQPV